MSVLVASKNEEDPIKNEGVRVVTTLFIDFFRRSRAANSETVMESLGNSNPF